MTEEQHKKENFVRHELLEMLKVIDKDILSTEYQLDGNDEYVEVRWLFQSGTSYRRKVNVTADSLLAVAKDVLKCID